MTDISDKSTPNKLSSEGEEKREPKAPLRLVSEPAPDVNYSQVNKQVQEPSDATKAPTSAPTPVPLPKATKVTFASQPTTSAAKHDSSISVDEDTDTSANIKLFIVDAIATAIAIAFTVLILQDNLPFLK